MEARIGRARQECKAHVLAFAAEARPVDPTDSVVLAIGVVVVRLAVADLVPSKHTSGTLPEHQAGQEIAPQLWACVLTSLDAACWARSARERCHAAPRHVSAQLGQPADMGLDCIFQPDQTPALRLV